MSIHFSGALGRSRGVVSAIGKELKLINLKGVNQINITFDPFASNVKATREFLFILSAPRVAATNPKCVVKTNVVCNRQPAEINFSLNEKAQEKLNLKDIRFLSKNLTTLEILQLCNKHVSTLAPEDDDTGKILTKAEKQKLASGKKTQKKK